MCIVVDANVAHRLNASDPDGSPVLRWLLRGKGRIVVSKPLLRELARAGLQTTLVNLDRAGRFIRGNETDCEALKNIFEAEGGFKSNDAHILALMTSTCCDLVFTHDKPSIMI